MPAPTRGRRTAAGIVTPGPGQRGAEAVAERLYQRIVAMGWPVGQVLGSESELRAELGVGRPVLREAVRLLEHQSVAFMRRGPGGGLVVAEPDEGAAVRALTVYLDYRGLGASDLYEVRLMVELLAVQLATERLTESGIARLRDALAAEEDPGDEPSAVFHQLHAVIAELSGNPMVHLFVEVLTRLSRERPMPGFVASESLQSEAWPLVHRAHDRIVEAICLGDVALARQRMRVHMLAVGAAVTTGASLQPAKRRT